MTISRRSNNSGAAGGNSMQRVSQREMQRSIEEVGDIDKDNRKNRNERKRLGPKYYYKYWGCVESCCGRCGAVLRFPSVKQDLKPFEYEDISQFVDETRWHGCPCCEIPIYERAKIDPKFYQERRLVQYKNLELLTLPYAFEPIPFPFPEED